MILLVTGNSIVAMLLSYITVFLLGVSISANDDIIQQIGCCL